jgi:hypothetical protein
MSSWPNNVDVSHLILELIHANFPEILSALSLVSKDFYFLCIRWLYRDLTINFADAPGRALLKRISRPASRISKYVRSIELQNCDQADWRLLHDSMRQFRRLAKLTWDHHANLPRNIANALHLLHPKAELQAKVSQMYISGPTDQGASYRIFDHPVLAQLTSLDFHASQSEYFYFNFKQDLLDLLIRSTALKHLRIYRGPIESPTHLNYPEMLHAFGPQFPRLETLILATRTHIFTENELTAWGGEPTGGLNCVI